MSCTRSWSKSTNRPYSRPEPEAPQPYEFTSNERWTLLLILAGVALFGLLAWLRVPDLPLCPWHALTGMHCPGCGLTRAAVAVLRLDPLQALSLNPLIIFVVGYVGYRLAVIGHGLATGRQLIAAWPRSCVIGLQVAVMVVWLGLLVIRTSTWFWPQLNPSGWGCP